mmetsp:Transcript_37186/g.73052  ORF Transcript_37186/g.73052 Transcript_37186/m.73052 type:complete len:211 (-) Transcript_37186:595-1227(-)
MDRVQLFFSRNGGARNRMKVTKNDVVLADLVCFVYFKESCMNPQVDETFYQLLCLHLEQPSFYDGRETVVAVDAALNTRWEGVVQTGDQLHDQSTVRMSNIFNRNCPNWFVFDQSHRYGTPRIEKLVGQRICFLQPDTKCYQSTLGTWSHHNILSSRDIRFVFHPFLPVAEVLFGHSLLDFKANFFDLRAILYWHHALYHYLCKLLHADV